MCFFRDKYLKKIPFTFNRINGDFDCSYCGLTTVQGAPQIVRDFLCNENNISSMKYAPKIIDGSLVAGMNKLTSLRNIRNYIKSVPYINFTNNQLVSHMLGLLLIKDLKFVYFTNKQLQQIMNKHLQGDRDIIDCASDLIDTGLGDFAQL